MPAVGWFFFKDKHYYCIYILTESIKNYKKRVKYVSLSVEVFDGIIFKDVL